MDVGAADNKVGACGEGWGQQREVKGKCVAPPGTAWGTAGALSAPTHRMDLIQNMHVLRSGCLYMTYEVVPRSGHGLDG